MSITYYIILVVIVCSWALISLMDMSDSKKRIRRKKETWGKLNEVSKRLRMEKGLEIWKSLGIPNKEEDTK